MLDIVAESRISLNELARRECVHLSTTWRWCLRGVKGHRLESLAVGGKRYTSVPAFERWLAKINGMSAAATQSPQQRVNDVEAAERELDRILRAS